MLNRIKLIPAVQSCLQKYFLSCLTQCMVRPRVARGFRRSGVSGLASMYPVSDWSLLCSGPSWISARVRSHYRTGLNGSFGSPVFASAGKTDPPSLLILSQTSASKGCGITSSLVLSMPSAIRRIWQPLRRVCSLRRNVRAQERSRRSGPVYWPAQSRARYGAAAFWRLQSRT